MSSTAIMHSTSRRNGLRSVAAMVRRDYLVTRSYRLAFVLDIFYGGLGLAIYFFISRTLGDPAPHSLGGAPTYFAFAAVGMAVGVVVEAATGSVARRVREEQLAGTLEVLAAQPVGAAALCLGFVGFPFLFGMVRAVAYLLLAAAWTDIDPRRASWVGLVIVLVGAGGALAVLGILGGAAVIALKRGEVLVGVAVSAVVVLSGAVFPITSLPPWLEVVARVLPLRFAFDGARSALFDGSFSEWSADAVALFAFGLVGLPLAIAAFSSSLRFARRRGALGEY